MQKTEISYCVDQKCWPDWVSYSRDEKAEPPYFANTMESILTAPVEESMKKARSAEYFEAWKKAAERDAHLALGLLAIRGPTIPPEMKEDVADMVIRITWRAPCDYMTAEEKISSCRVNSNAMEEYAWALAKKEAREQWERVLAETKLGESLVVLHRATPEQWERVLAETK